MNRVIKPIGPLAIREDYFPVAASLLKSLTPQQRNVAILIAFGQDTVSIAMTLGVSQKTIDCHYKAIKEKLCVFGRHGVPMVVFAGLGLLKSGNLE